MKDLIVNNYYDKLLKLSKNYKTNSFVKRNKREIICFLKFIIYKNNDYLLNDSILAYISRNEQIISSLKKLHGDEYDLTHFLMYYYSAKLHESRGTNTRSLSYQLMDDDTKKLIDKANNYYVHYIAQNTKYLLPKTLLIERIIGIILGYCHLHNKFEEFDKIFDNVMDNPELIIDNLYLNGMEHDSIFLMNERDISILIYRVINKINSVTNESKVIK